MQCQRERDLRHSHQEAKRIAHYFFSPELAYGSEVYWYLFCGIGQQRLWCSIPALTVRVRAQEKPGNLRNATEGHNLRPNTVSPGTRSGREDDDVISTLQ
jgi:hypothetical protein